MTARKHYVVLAQMTEGDVADWVVAWTLDEARSFEKRLRTKGYTVQVREVGPVLEGVPA